jgi:hypothetical protein
MKAAQRVECDPAGERLGGLVQKSWRGAAKYQEARRSWTPVRKDSQNRKDIWPALDFIQDDQSAKTGKSEARIFETREVCGVLEVEALRRPLVRFHDALGQRRLAYLPRSQDCHDREVS